MPASRPSMIGQPVQVPAGLKGRCDSCREEGADGRLVTDGTEIADVVAEEEFNGRWSQETGRAAVWLNCPDCGDLVQFAIPGMRL